jgi:hypothetical protein
LDLVASGQSGSGKAQGSGRSVAAYRGTRDDQSKFHDAILPAFIETLVKGHNKKPRKAGLLV